MNDKTRLVNGWDVEGVQASYVSVIPGYPKGRRVWDKRWPKGFR